MITDDSGDQLCDCCGQVLILNWGLAHGVAYCCNRVKRKKSGRCGAWFQVYFYDSSGKRLPNRPPECLMTKQPYRQKNERRIEVLEYDLEVT